MIGHSPSLNARSIVVISDRVEHCGDGRFVGETYAPDPADRDAAVVVEGGYLERLPLALIASGRFDTAEIWHHVTGADQITMTRVSPRLVRRAFPLDDAGAPFDNRAMARYFRDRGTPGLLMVYGLGVSPAVLEAAGDAIIVYNSIDAPALRVPEQVSRWFDVVLTGAPWQADVVDRRHPGLPAPVLPVGPEFAATDQFRPLGCPKDYDLIYVAAAQPYKRHDILFDTVERMGGLVSALCVFGYGELAESYRDEIARRGLRIDCVMPPVIPHSQVNSLMNRARIGIVAGVDDGAPAILTEYMLAGLPVLANRDLCCGLQYVVPGTGEIAAAADWPAIVQTMLAQLERYHPREVALSRWSWPVTAARFLKIINDAREARAVRTREPARNGAARC